MKALVLGATGAVGHHIVDMLIDNHEVQEVHVFVRRPVTFTFPKVTVHIVNFDEPREWAHLVTGDILFSAMGTNRKQAGTKEAQWMVDYTYQYEMARIAAQNGVKKYGLVSSLGANPKSPFFYLSMKGQLEEIILELPFEAIVIARPATLIREKPKLIERISCAVFGVINKAHILMSQEPVKTADVANVLVKATLGQQYGISILENETIHERAGYFND